jgi:tetratricopeptide (TPR) repeat protein
MSLLMDALRRAEQEKKYQQAREQNTGAADSDASATEASVRADVRAESESPASEHPASESDTTLAPPTRALPPTTPAVSASAGDVSQNFSIVDVLDDDDSLSLPNGLELEPLEDDDGDEDVDLSGDDTHSEPYAGVSEATDNTIATTIGEHERVSQTQTMPSSRALESDLNAYFDQSQSIEIPRLPARGDVTLEDVAAHNVVNAQTVFAAAEPPRSKRVLLVAVGFAVAIVLAIGGVGLYFAQKQPGPRYIAPPTVADGVERPPLRELPVVSLEQPLAASAIEVVKLPALAPLSDVASDTTAPAIATFATTTQTGSVTTPNVADALVATTSGAASAQLAELPELAVVPPSTPTSRPTSRPKPSSQPRRSTSQSSGTDREFGIGVGQLSIARTRAPPSVDGNVQIAYAAFQAGELQRAAEFYSHALHDKPRQRDALLGLGAVAVARGDLENAYRHYMNVLKNYPADAIAAAALLSLTGGDQARSAARLRVMLDENRDAPYLHFVLGNWYARAQRWGEAQQAYFEAMSLLPENADYAYNLAVSLDHLGQSVAALKYYQKSLSLVDASAGAFNTASVLTRVAELSASGIAN